MFGVECRTSNGSTYEIFDNYNDSQSFANSNENSLFIFTADFNLDRIYIEDGLWNYEDFSDTFINQKVIENYEIHG